MRHHRGRRSIQITERQRTTGLQHRIGLRQAPTGTSQRRPIIATCDRDRHRRATAIACRNIENITNNFSIIQLILSPIRRVAPLAAAINRKTSITARHSALSHHTGRRSIQITEHQRATGLQHRIALRQTPTSTSQRRPIIATRDRDRHRRATAIRC